MTVRFSYPILAIVAAACFTAEAQTQAAPSPSPGQSPDQNPPTTLPFEPTVRSAPPERPTYPQQDAPPPGDPLCYEIGPIIRAGAMASRFATLAPSTAQGAVIGRFDPGEEMSTLGAGYCTVTIPAADPRTADAPYNQVTCPLDMIHSDAAFMNDVRERRDTLAERIGECPAVARWTGAAPEQGSPGRAPVSEPFVFSHPDVAVQIVIEAAHRRRTGEWPLDYMRTLTLAFRTPNPDRPEPEPEPETPAPSSALP